LLVYAAIFSAYIADCFYVFQDYPNQFLMTFILTNSLYLIVFALELREKDQRPKLSVAQEILITIPFLVACTLLLGILYPYLCSKSQIHE